MRVNKNVAYVGAAVVGLALVGGGVWLKAPEPEATVIASQPAVLAPAPVVMGDVPLEPAAVVPGEAVARVPESLPMPQSEEARPDVPEDTAPSTDLAVQETAPEVVYPSPEEVAGDPVLEEPQFVDPDADDLAAIAPLESVEPEPEAVDPNRAHLDEFVRVSLLVFARNDAYMAAVQRAQDEGNVEREEALRFEMAKEATAVIASEFPWGLDRYVELAQAVRADPDLEAQAAVLMENAVR